MPDGRLVHIVRLTMRSLRCLHRLIKSLHRRGSMGQLTDEGLLTTVDLGCGCRRHHRQQLEELGLQRRLARLDRVVGAGAGEEEALEYW